MNGVITSVYHSSLFRTWLVAVAVLLLAFSYPLYRLVRFSIGHDLYSHLALVPFAALFLVWQKRRYLPRNFTPAPRLAIAPMGTGLALLLGLAMVWNSGAVLAEDDFLAYTILAFVILLAGTVALFLGRDLVHYLAFPLGFLALMAPFPTVVKGAIEIGLQRGSTEAAYLLLRGAGTPVFRDGYRFELPGIALEVAPQCSGIHSTLALFIVSLTAGYLFLRSPWRRALLAAAIIPLALLRNGFRVFTLGMLCVHVDPALIHSYIHRQGGPIFFALSLIPFSLLLLFLIRQEARTTKLPRTTK